MPVILQWLFRLIYVCIFVGILVMVLAWWIASRSIPDYSAQWRVDGVTAPVEIIRNTAAVPHIFATTDEDVFFGLGFAHAQDRLWQMLVARRTAQGRLSEIFGASTLEIDDLMRRLDFDGHAARSLDALDADTRDVLASYADGVNAWLRLVGAEALGRGAPEFFIFEPEITPWRPADSVALTMVMALQMTPHLETEVLRAQTSVLLDNPDRLADIMPDISTPAMARFGDYGALFDPASMPQLAQNAPPTPRHPLHPNRLGWARAGASNVFAVSADRSVAEGALLANDPHLALSAPSIWYLARMELSTGGVIGATIPGIPAILAGRSDELAWGITYSYLDDMDLFVEQVNADDPQQYLTPQGWANFETRREIIEIADQPAVTITIQQTENGPVIPGYHFDLATITPRDHVISLSWTALSDENTSVQAGINLMRAQTIEAAIAAGQDMVAPAQNLMLATADGDIAMQIIGHMPRRRPNHQTLGRIPSPGWIAGNRWQGVFDYDQNPTFLNPQQGVLGNTNNPTVDTDFPLHLSHHWGDSHRITRLENLMSARRIHTRNSFIEAQLDTVSIAARSLLPIIARDMWLSEATAPQGTPERQRQRALDLLANWNGEMNEHLPEPLIFAAWMRELQMRLIRDDLGPLAQQFTALNPVFLERVFRDANGASIWCDIRPSNMVETCEDMARISLDNALLFLEETYGPDLETWQWGTAHEAQHTHQALGQSNLFSWIVNIHQPTSGGDFTLQRGMTSGNMPDPFTNIHAAGYRGVYDFSDPDSSVFIIATGQSGHPLSRHYDDLGALWRRGEYIPMTLDIDLARAGNIGITTLQPN